MTTIAAFIAQLSGLPANAAQNALPLTGQAGQAQGDAFAAFLSALETFSLQQEQNGGGGFTSSPALNNTTLSFLTKTADPAFGAAEIQDRALFIANQLDEIGSEGLFLEQLTSRIELIRQKIEIFQEAEQAGKPVNILALIATGLSPSQLAELQQNVRDLEQKLGRPITLEDLIAGVGDVLPKAEAKESVQPVFAEQVVHLAKKIDARPEEPLGQYIVSVLLPQKHTQTVQSPLNPDLPVTLPLEQPVGELLEDNLAAALNAITPGEAAARSAYTPALSINGKAAGYDFNPKSGTPFQQPAKIAGLAAGSDKNITVPSTFFNSFAAQSAAEAPVFDFSAPLLETDRAAGFDIYSGLPFSNVSQAAHAITHATQHAGQPHPATQLVSAKIQQLAQSGDTQSITLHLEPAELGKVQVRLEFSVEKKVKAVLLIEKPETYHMLHRDSFALERALQDSGLDVDSGGISFELAEDGYAFDKNNDGRGGDNLSNGAGDNSAEADSPDEDGTILESIMTWAVDPHTGHARYTIIA